MTTPLELIKQARERATTDSPSHALINQLTDALETALATLSETERLRLAVVHRLLDTEATLAAIKEGKQSTFDYWQACTRNAEAERDAALAVIEQANDVGGGNTWKDDLDRTRHILAQSPASALANVKADTLRDAANKHFKESVAQGLGDPTAVAEWLRAEADKIEKEAAL